MQDVVPQLSKKRQIVEGGNSLCLKGGDRPKGGGRIVPAHGANEQNAQKMLEINKKFNLVLYRERIIMYNIKTIIHF